MARIVSLFHCSLVFVVNIECQRASDQYSSRTKAHKKFSPLNALYAFYGTKDCIVGSASLGIDDLALDSNTISIMKGKRGGGGIPEKNRTVLNNLIFLEFTRKMRSFAFLN